MFFSGELFSGASGILQPEKETEVDDEEECGGAEVEN